MAYFVGPNFEIESFKNSSLYRYHIANYLPNLNNIIITIINVEIRQKIIAMHHLCQCYDLLIKNGYDNLIYEMISTSNQYDIFAI